MAGELNALMAGPVEESAAPVEEAQNPELEVAFGDFDNPELPLEVRAEALKLILDLTQ